MTRTYSHSKAYALRVAAGLTLKEAAWLAKITRQQLAEYEGRRKARRVPGADNLAKMAAAYQCSTEDFYGEAENE